MKQPVNPSIWGTWTLVAFVLIGAFALFPILPDRQAPDGVDLTRALRDVAVVADARNPMGSPRNREVRDYLTREFQQLGLEVEVQAGDVIYDHPNRGERHVRAARVENVLARLPGQVSNNALVVMSHYDSRPDGPGAGDAAAGVAAVLEAARAMVTEPTPARDVWFVITDGEEMGLLGAQAFFRQHRSRDSVGLVLNFEARGSAGPSLLFETGPNNGDLLDAMAEILSPVGTSLAYEVYRFMPNDTDMTIPKALGIPGLNFAFADNYFDYHTEGDSPENLSRRSLGEHVRNAVTLTRHFAALDALPAESANRTFLFNPPPWPSVSYGPVMGGVLLALTVGLALWVLAAGGARRVRPVGESLRGMVAVMVVLLVVNSIVQGLHGGLLAGAGFRDLRYWQIFYQYHLAMLGFGLVAFGLGAGLLAAFANGLRPAVLIVIPLVLLALTAMGQNWSAVSIGTLLLVAALLPWFRRPLAVQHLQVGGWVLWITLAVTAQVLAATASFVFVLPLLWVLLTHALIRLDGANDAVAVIGPLLIWAPLFYALYLMLGVSTPEIPMVTVALLLALLAGASVRWGQLGRGLLAPVAGAAGVAIIVGVAVNEPFSERYQRPTELFLAHDADTGESYWASGDPDLNPWTRLVLGDDPPRRALADILPGARAEIWSRSVKAEVDDPEIEVLADRATGTGRSVELAVRPPYGAEYLNLMFAPDSQVLEAGINGMAVPVPADLGSEEWWRWRFYGDTREPVVVNLLLAPDSPLSLRLVAVAYRWPEGLEPDPRPAGWMKRPYAWSDATVSYRNYRIE